MHKSAVLELIGYFESSNANRSCAYNGRLNQNLLPQNELRMYINSVMLYSLHCCYWSKRWLDREKNRLFFSFVSQFCCKSPAQGPLIQQSDVCRKLYWSGFV